MKKLLNIFVLLASLLVIAVSCIKEEMEGGFGDDAGAPVSIKLDTRAFGDGESKVNNVRVIVAKQNAVGTIITNKFINDPANPIKLETMTGLYRVCVIINETEDGTELADLKDLKTDGTFSDLDNIKLPFTGRIMTNIPMYGSKSDVRIVAAQSDTDADIYIDGTNQGKILKMNVDRLACKISPLKLRSKGLGTLQSVKLSNLPDAVSLTGVAYRNPGNFKAITKSASDFKATQPTPEGLVWEMATTADILLPYSSFSPINNESEAILLTVTTSNKTVDKRLGHQMVAENGKLVDFTLHRNTSYAFTGTIGTDDLGIEVNVANWEKVEQDYPAGGGSFWEMQPKDSRVGLDGTQKERTAAFTAKFATSAVVSTYKWYRKRQLNDMSYVTEELINNENGVTITTEDDNSSQLVIVASKLEDAGEIYCVGETESPDGSTETLESSRATLMVMGTEIDDAGIYPDMQMWEIPRNALFGATCLLRDTRDNKLYRVKLMADGNWWMIQDLAYGNASTETIFKSNATNMEITNLIASGLYGVCASTGLATGGYLYNGFAALQMGTPSDDKAENDFDKTLTQLSSLCPDGWHLPGNLENTYNQEFIILQNALQFSNANIMEVLTKFNYNSPTDFNSYTLRLLVPSPSHPFAVDNVSYRGGVFITYTNWAVQYGDLGITSVRNNGIIQNTNQPLPANIGAPIRCVRNFKN